MLFVRAVRVVVVALLVLTGAAIPATRWLTAKGEIDPDHAALREFLVALEPATRPGERITLIVPDAFRDQDTLGYRARYLLPGRTVVLAGKADAVAYWRMPPPPGARRIGEGFLVR